MRCEIEGTRRDDLWPGVRQGRDDCCCLRFRASIISCIVYRRDMRWRSAHELYGDCCMYYNTEETRVEIAQEGVMCFLFFSFSDRTSCVWGDICF